MITGSTALNPGDRIAFSPRWNLDRVVLGTITRISKGGQIIWIGAACFHRDDLWDVRVEKRAAA